jgi:hypothetical protein
MQTAGRTCALRLLRNKRSVSDKSKGGTQHKAEDEHEQSVLRRKGNIPWLKQRPLIPKGALATGGSST